MSALPEGHLTILFTDIEGSTELVQRLGPLFPELLDLHHRLLRGAFLGQGGHEVRTMGDAFFYVFEDALPALRAATDGQRAIHDHSWPHGETLRVRMGLHSGPVTRFDQDYAGFELHRAARIAGAGHGGQVLVSRTTMAEIGDALPSDIDVHDCGSHWLKDLSEPEPLVRVVVEGLPDVDRPPSSLGRPPLRIDVVDPSADEAEDEGAAPRDLSTLRRLLRRGVAGDEGSVRLRPEELERLARAEPDTLEAQRLGRIAAWSEPRYRIDTRFVRLSLLLDRGEQVSGERWVAEPERLESLLEILQAGAHRAFVVLGPPGSGKSTLLRHLELSQCADALQQVGQADSSAAGSDEDADEDQGEGEGVVTFFVPLNSYRARAESAAPPPPLEWLQERWQRRHPELPRLGRLMDQGRVLLLLDGLNEMPHADEAEYRRMVSAWRGALQDLLERGAGNRAVFSCRSLDYSAPLSTPALRVPQVRVEPFDDRRVRQFLALHIPKRAPEVWRQLSGTPTLELLRTPYFLALLAEQVVEQGAVPLGRASLFTGFVRQAMRRELERANPLFQDGALIHARDSRRLAQAKRWRSPWQLPTRGTLIPGLEGLAYRMQAEAPAGEGLQVRVDYDDALDLLDDPRGEDLLRAGVALAVLDEDVERDEVLFYHQLLQEYFAARRLSATPEPERVAKPWRSTAVEPPLASVLETLDPADPLPVLPTTGWEETSRLAAVMADDPASAVIAIAEHDLPLAGHCAAEPELRDRLPDDAVRSLRARLVTRAEEQEADLRARIAAARALGEIGDPRFERVRSAEGEARVPPWIAVPAGEARMGAAEDDVLARDDERPAHSVVVEGFRMARFPVTNAEWRCFVEAGGYDDERWWHGPAAAAWRRGEGVTEGQKANWRGWRRRFQRKPSALDDLEAQGQMTPETVAEWRRYLHMDETAFERALEGLFPDERVVTPRQWGQESYAHPAQAVVGVSLHEARAYAAWLSAVTGVTVRLPTEAEWSRAARGAEGRRFAWGQHFDPLAANVAGTRLKAPSPVGVFPDGRTPEGIDDLTGSCFEWTRSLYGEEDGSPTHTYPYRADDGREDDAAPSQMLRVTRGGSWADGERTARAAYRYPVHPAVRHSTVGVRLICDLEP